LCIALRLRVAAIVLLILLDQNFCNTWCSLYISLGHIAVLDTCILSLVRCINAFEYISSDEEIHVEFVHLYKLRITAPQKGLITNNAVDLEALRCKRTHGPP
jgi:hypothetical protein